MTLTKQIEARIFQALKDKKDVEKNILRTLLGDIQTLQARTNSEITEDQVINCVKKLLKGIDETLGFTPDNTKLLEEKQILSQLLPQTIDKTEILNRIKPILESLEQANSDGKATGFAMKLLKDSKCVVNGQDVAEVVKFLRDAWRAKE